MHEWHLLRVVVVIKLVSCVSPKNFGKKSDVLSSFLTAASLTYYTRFDCGCLCSHYINIKSKKKE